VCNSLFFFSILNNGIRGRSFIRTLSMFNCTVIGTDFVSFTSFAVVIFLVDFLEELFGPVPLGILFSLAFNNNKNLFLFMAD
jgi:hypothetical protein